MMSASSPESARFAAEHRSSMGIVMLTELESARKSIAAYKEAAREHGWEPTPENIMIGAHTCIADTDEEAEQHLGKGIDYFYGALSGGPQTAARIVLQKTRYYEDADKAAHSTEKRKRLKELTLRDRMDVGGVLCGSPETVVQQIRRLHEELGHGLMQLNFKVGTVPNDVVTRGMTLFKEQILPQVRDLGLTVEEHSDEKVTI
jgi:alkanesulfonate monooxygenase SsuD/methylene tetrahydromethanopterin reductase-like flavin-dependent oxidoreductase (luciferase family)